LSSIQPSAAALNGLKKLFRRMAEFPRESLAAGRTGYDGGADDGNTVSSAAWAAVR
jgi:hypothetical protein